MSDQAEAASLTQLLLDETIQALGLPAGRLSRALIRPLVYRPANRFARLGVIFDRYMANGGFPAAARWALESHQVQVRLRDPGSVPNSGPLLVTSNHPGGMDCLALAAGLGRSDLKIVASGMPFLRNLPEVARHLILVSRVGAHARMSRAAPVDPAPGAGRGAADLPRGRVEPDPAFFTEAEISMEKWSPSVRILLEFGAPAEMDGGGRQRSGLQQGARASDRPPQTGVDGAPAAGRVLPDRPSGDVAALVPADDFAQPGPGHRAGGGPRGRRIEANGGRGRLRPPGAARPLGLDPRAATRSRSSFRCLKSIGQASPRGEHPPSGGTLDASTRRMPSECLSREHRDHSTPPLPSRCSAARDPARGGEIKRGGGGKPRPLSDLPLPTRCQLAGSLGGGEATGLHARAGEGMVEFPIGRGPSRCRAPTVSSEKSALSRGRAAPGRCRPGAAGRSSARGR